MPKTVSRDTPLAEITLRRYEAPQNLDSRDMAKKLCLSLGLLQPGDSRDVVVDVFSVLHKSEAPMNSEDVVAAVIEYRQKHNLPQYGVAASNIRRQLKRLRDLFLVEKIANEYRITEDEKLLHIFEERIEKYYLRSIVTRVKEYLKAMDS